MDEKGQLPTGANGRQDSPRNALHDENGNFAVGNPGGPGRPRGTLDFMTCVKKGAKAAGVSVEAMVWSVARGLSIRGAAGDANAGKAFLERACGILDTGAGVNVNVGVGVTGNVGVGVGPPIPATRDLATYLDELHEAASELHVVDVTPATDLEELLS